MGKLANSLALPVLPLLFTLIGDPHPQAILAPCGPAGPSILVNGRFDSNISGWSSPVGFGSAQWSREDANGSPSSGSLALVNNAVPSGQEVSVSQCQPIQSGVTYDLAAKIKPVNFCCLVSTKGLREIKHTGFLYVLLNFYSRPSCGGAPFSQYVRVDSTGNNVWQSLGQTFTTPGSTASVRTTLSIYKAEPGDTLACHFDDISITASRPSDPTALCLGGRFKVQAQWSTPDGQSGPGQPVSLTSDTGYFSFFNPNNVEMLVKVLNGCGVNSRFWVFAGGLTNVGVDLTITDLVTGAVQAYTNPLGTVFLPIQDTSAFASCSSSATADESAISAPIDPAARPPYVRSSQARAPESSDASTRPLSTAAACVSNATTACLNNGRFSVIAQWTTPDGATGPGRVLFLTDETGFFWFFNQSNVEIAVKVLNGCGLDSNYWVFAAGLTNLQVLLTVTDTQTGVVKTYTNPQGRAFQPIQDTSAFRTCP